MPRPRTNEAKDVLRDDYFELLQDAVDTLWDDLAENSGHHADCLAQFPSNRSDCDLLAATGALQSVLRFLGFSPTKSLHLSERRKRFRIIEELRQALIDLLEGSAPAPMLRARKKRSGRRADVSSILTIK